MTGSSTEISAKEKTIILYVNRVSFEKNLNFLLDAYKTETFGQVVLESMASGLSVVGLFAEGVEDLIEDQKTGLLLDVTDDMPRNVQIEKYKALLNQLVSDSNLRIKMKRNALATSKKYSWWDAMEKMVNFYKEAVSDNTQDDTTSEQTTALESVVIDQIDETITGETNSTEEEDSFTDSSSEKNGDLAKTKFSRVYKVFTTK